MNEVQNNPFQPDVNYRGYTASPLLGTPQGLSVYMDGVRLNQPFGEVVNWDLIPRIAIASTTLMPGSNPALGLNTLGGALSVQTKDGSAFKGTSVQATFGDFLRRAVEVEHGGQSASKAFDWYLAGTLFGDDGWRDDSPSDVRQLFGKAGWHRTQSDATVSIAHSTNDLTGNGLQEFRLLENDYSQHLHEAGHDEESIDARQSLGAAPLGQRVLVPGERLLSRSEDRHVERRHQRGFARPVDLPAGRSGDCRADGGRVQRISDVGGECGEHTVPRCCSDSIVFPY
ncbi:MAG: hypothetical protein QM736_00090 [Vicinamibacterales bacterium]